MTTPKAGRLSGIQTALRYTGLPTSWLSKRPKLPSRNWLIFLSVTTSATGYYIYDRQQCKKIRQHYIDLVKSQAEEPVRPLDAPRRVTVYGSKWPGDEDYNQSIKYFRKYVKVERNRPLSRPLRRSCHSSFQPILVAAAVDYELVPGKRHGDIAERVANEIRLRRRRELGLDPIPDSQTALPTYKPPEQLRQDELEGGIVLVGRPTFKEFMAGLKKGWSEGVENVDYDEVLARELESDAHFDEVDEPRDGAETWSDGFDRSNLPSPNNSPVFSPLQMSTMPRSAPSSSSSASSGSSYEPPAVIPPIPPLLLVTFTNRIGLTQIPLMIWDWFNQRHKVRSGAEAGYCLVMKSTRPIIPPTLKPESLFGDISHDQPLDQGDLAFDKDVESLYKSSLSKIPSEIEESRKKYYGELPAKLETARSLARGTREPTKEEMKNPPPTEVELRAARMKKEKRWRRDVAGWEIVKPEQDVAWDERFRHVLRRFTDPSSAN